MKMRRKNTYKNDIKSYNHIHIPYTTMSQILSLGAINKFTGEYVYPKRANKKDEYICPDCNKDLIFVQGKIRVHHFRHKVDSIDPCHHYSKPTESQIHKNAKMLMKTLLENKTHIHFIRECACCKISSEIYLPEIAEGSIISLEHRFNYKSELKIADVAHTFNNKIKGIYEICHTHKTSCEDRPEPWVEIDANSLLTSVNADNEPLVINCFRCEKCEKCEKCKNEIIFMNENKKKAIAILLEWIRKDNNILPFHDFIDFDNIGIPPSYNYWGLLANRNYSPDIIFEDNNCNDRYYIDLTQKNYSIELQQQMIDNEIGVYYVDMNWILQQTYIPSKIESIKIFDPDDDWILQQTKIPTTKIKCVKISGY